MDARPVVVGRPLLVAAGVVSLLLLGLLATQVVLLTDQLRTIRTQRSIAQQQAARAFPLLDAVRPLAGDARGSLPALRSGARRLDGLVRGATPLVAELRAADAPGAARATIALASMLLRARIGATAAGLRRITPLLAAAAASAVELEGLTRRSLGVQGDSLAIQRRSLAVQKTTLALLRTSLGIQRETLTHAESIDRKTGPAPPATPVAAPAG